MTIAVPAPPPAPAPTEEQTQLAHMVQPVRGSYDWRMDPEAPPVPFTPYPREPPTPLPFSLGALVAMFFADVKVPLPSPSLRFLFFMVRVFVLAAGGLVPWFHQAHKQVQEER